MCIFQRLCEVQASNVPVPQCQDPAKRLGWDLQPQVCPWRASRAGCQVRCLDVFASVCARFTSQWFCNSVVWWGWDLQPQICPQRALCADCPVRYLDVLQVFVHASWQFSNSVVSLFFCTASRFGWLNMNHSGKLTLRNQLWCLQNLPTLSVFKAQLKTFLLDRPFDEPRSTVPVTRDYVYVCVCVCVCVWMVCAGALSFCFAKRLLHSVRNCLSLLLQW